MFLKKTGAIFYEAIPLHQITVNEPSSNEEVCCQFSCLSSQTLVITKLSLREFL